MFVKSIMEEGVDTYLVIFSSCARHWMRLKKYFCIQSLLKKEQ